MKGLLILGFRKHLSAQLRLMFMANMTENLNLELVYHPAGGT